MLQIIIWLGCFYLALKGVEIFLSSLPEERSKDRQGYAVGVLLVAILGAMTFVLLANEQADSSPTMSSFSSGYDAGSSTEIERAAQAGAEAAADAAAEGN
jgi:hypothetical protein